MMLEIVEGSEIMRRAVINDRDEEINAMYFVYARYCMTTRRRRQVRI